MPKDTFHNLSEDKKRKIFDAALKEFSTRRFSEASINQIVKSAGIPRGSFYQYFEGKEDLYLYMIEDVSKDKAEVLGHLEGTDSDADVFEVILHRTREFLERGSVKPGYVEAAMLMEIDNSEFTGKIRKASADRYVKLVERDKERGIIKPEVDSELVINMISTFSMNEYFRNGSDKEGYLKNLGNAIKMIKEGVCL